MIRVDLGYTLLHDVRFSCPKKCPPLPLDMFHICVCIVSFLSFCATRAVNRTGDVHLDVVCLADTAGKKATLNMRGASDGGDLMAMTEEARYRNEVLDDDYDFM